MSFQHLVPGDELWVLNGRQTSAFEANVISVTEHTIGAEIPAKNAGTWFFDRETGASLEGPNENHRSQLVLDTDWRVNVILDRKNHASYHEKVIQLAAAFRKDPEDWRAAELKETVRQWADFATRADPVALTVTSIEEYEDAKLVSQLIAQE